MIADRLRSALGQRDQWPTLSVNEYLDMVNQFTYNGVQYTLPGDKQEDIDPGLTRELVRSAYKSNGVVFACMLVRMMTFSEARFQYRERNNGRPGALFGDASLQRFERPWPGATTADLMKRMIQCADLAGNFYGVRRNTSAGPGVRWLRPEWVELLIGGPPGAEGEDIMAWDTDAEVIGYRYHPGGKGSKRPVQHFLASEVAHYAPIPDPEAQFRGMSWLTPIIREVMGDKAATQHKLSFFENGATPNLVVKLNVEDLTKFQAWVREFREEYEGQLNAYKTMFLGAGADPTVVGANLRQLDFKVVQGAGETRIAAAANVPPVIVGLSEGLQAATYSNYGQARRRFNDLSMRPLWRDAAGSLQTIADMPRNDGSCELWYDDRDIPALKDDKTDEATIMSEKAKAASMLFQSGFEPDSIVVALDTGDFTMLKHTGLQTVQTQPAKVKDYAEGDAPSASSNGAVPAGSLGKEA